jgi:endoglucanase
MQAPIKLALRQKALGLAVMLGMGVAAGQAQAAVCSYTVVNEWNTGFQGSITITNNGTTAINGWTVGWQYSANKITSSWNATLSGSNPYTATALDWNKTIQPGQSVSFGVQGDKNGSAAEKPTITGAVCSTVTTSSSVATTSSSPATSTSSSVKTSSSVPTTSTSSSVQSSACATTSQCNWYGTLYPSCQTTTSGWGYENGKSCIANTTCAAQPAPYGVVNGCPTTSSSVATTSSSVRTSSSVTTTSSVRTSSSVVTSTSSSVRTSSSVGTSSSVSSTGKFRVNSEGKITKDGVVIPAHCGNWFGLEGRHEPSNDSTNPSGAPMELYIGNMWWVNGGAGTGRTIAQGLTELKAKGINMLRIPITPQTLDPNNPQGKEPNLKNHQSVRQTNARQALEDFIKAAAAADVQVFLDIHSCSNYVGWRKGRLDARPPYVDATREDYDFKREAYSCSATNNPSTVTTIHAYDEAKWIANLKEIAGLPAKLGVNNVIGIDIFNEPWDYTWAEWKGLSERAYQAINATNPNLIVIVEGISGNANNQDGTPLDTTVVPHGDTATNPNWGENLYEAGTNPINIPKDQLLFSPHTYGPSVFVQKQFLDPTQTACVGLEGDDAGKAKCRVVINPTVLEQGWEEHFGYLRDLGYGILVGEYGGNMDWPLKTKQNVRNMWSHITTNVDEQWQQAAANYFKKKGINACYWSLNPESADTLGWWTTPWDPVSADDKWGQWGGFDPRKTTVINTVWGN